MQKLEKRFVRNRCCRTC